MAAATNAGAGWLESAVQTAPPAITRMPTAAPMLLTGIFPLSVKLSSFAFCFSLIIELLL